VDIEKNLEASLSLNNILREKVNQLDELLKDISWIAYNNKNPLIAEDLEWEQMITSILKELRISGKDKVQFFYTIEQRAAFRSDVARIQTIIRNLMSNSFKYFNPTSANCWTNLKISVEESHAEIIISDNGIGIDQEYLNKIFKMFYKATEYPKGPGLGLYIVKAMTEKLDGSITVDSTIGEGSTFRMRIPNMDNNRRISSTE
jgi:signal transduction histidine kinase